jgi:hypothetical protein
MLLLNALARFFLVVDLHIILFSGHRVKRFRPGADRFVANNFI